MPLAYGPDSAGQRHRIDAAALRAFGGGGGVGGASGSFGEAGDTVGSGVEKAADALGDEGGWVLLLLAIPRC